MALNMTAEQKQTGKDNFNRVADGLTRRDFMKSLALTSGIALPVGAAAYFAYSHDEVKDKPLRAALIGGGDEGNVLVTDHNPAYVQIMAVCDIRPSNMKRIFEGGDWTVDDKGEWKLKKQARRVGLNHHYGLAAEKTIKKYDDYKKVLEDKDVEAVIIALPLHLHAQVAIDAMKAGKHVLCEKLMGWNITQCKEMIKVAEETDRLLSIGHQRHYSMLYAHAVEVVNSGVLGEIRHIRALWHRNNAKPRKEGVAVDKSNPNTIQDGWRPEIPKADMDALNSKIKSLGYKSMEELVRWRLFNRTGGGLMAELGSHQLDACSIFLGKVHPLAVQGFGGRLFYRDEREIDDHVFVTFEFPGPNYFKGPDTREVKDKDDKIIVTYSSINTNGALEPYGECLMGSKGSLVVETEQNVMLYPEPGGRGMTVSVSTGSSGKPVLDSSGSTGGPGPAAMAVTSGSAASRGYREEMEHFAYCIRMREKEGVSRQDRPQVRCHGTAAMADAIIALTSNLAMRKGQRIEFKESWFDPKSPDVPDAENKAEVVKG